MQPADSATHAPSSRPIAWRRWPWLLPVVAVLVVVIGYGGTLEGYFVGDDFGFVGRYFDFPLPDWPRLFVHGWTDDLWQINLRELRPLNALAFILDARIWGLDPFGFRVSNLALHALCALLVGLLARKATAGDAIATFAATALFALHPVTAGAVAWITGRVDLVSTAFYLGGVLAFLHYRETRHSLPLTALAACQFGVIFTKELGLTLPAMLFVADLLMPRPERSWRARATWLPYAGCATVLAAYFVCRYVAFEASGVGGIGTGLPDLFSATTYADMARRQAGYLTHLLPPLESWAQDWRAEAWALSGRHLVRVLAGLAALALGAWAIRRWYRTAKNTPDTVPHALFFGPAWYLVATLPLLMTYYAPRHLYLAAAGGAIALVLLLRGCLRPPWFAAASAAGVLFLGLQLRSTLEPWHRQALLSRIIAQEVARIASDAPRGTPLILDVPTIEGQAFCWPWAVPHALRPPFQRDRLDERLLVVSNPGAYAFGARWSRQPMLAELRETKQPGWLIQVNSRGTVRVVSLSAEKLRRAATYLEAAASAPERAWERFSTQLKSP